ncbi:MAG: PIN domain-containing protein [Solirubrobacteraceae bacterium]
MRDVVLDASVLLKWFHSQGERNAKQARSIRHQFEAGELRVLAPPLLWLEVMNVAARHWKWPHERLDRLAATLPNLGFELLTADLADIGRWAAAGLTAYDAAYVAVADKAGATLVTDDEQIVCIAPELACALGEWA